MKSELLQKLVNYYPELENGWIVTGNNISSENNKILPDG